MSDEANRSSSKIAEHVRKSRAASPGCPATSAWVPTQEEVSDAALAAGQLLQDLSKQLQGVRRFGTLDDFGSLAPALNGDGEG